MRIKAAELEDAESLPDSFAMKIHALRNGTHHMSMVNPVTWDYLSTFVSHAVPLYDFDGDGAAPVKLKKVVLLRCSEIAASRDSEPPPTRDETRDEDYEGQGMTREQRKARRERLRRDRGVDEGTEDRRSAKGDKSEELEQQRLEKERRAREYMEKPARSKCSKR